MPFHPHNYANFVAQASEAHSRLIRDYPSDAHADFDFIVVGSGMGGGILADDLADRLPHKRILLVEAGSFLYPTHVYNTCRIPNFRIASHFGVDNFHQYPSAENFIGEKPQLNFGGRSIFWSGLIPTLQQWELEFFPNTIRNDLANGYLARVSDTMNASVSMGTMAARIVEYLQSTPLNDDFVIAETPRALHQPYLLADGTPAEDFFVEPTGVFNTAELIINQVGLTPGKDPNGAGLHVKLHAFVEAIDRTPEGWCAVRTTDTLDGASRTFYAPKAVMAAGSIESPKLLCRSDHFHALPDPVKHLVGRGITDHPTTDSIHAKVTNLGSIPIPKTKHAKIIFYSRGHREPDGSIRYPFNIEMNVNHEYWHLRNNDPLDGPSDIEPDGDPVVDLKFSFGNCLDDANAIHSHSNDQYTPEISFKNLDHLPHLFNDRFPKLAGWHKSPDDVFSVLNNLVLQIFSKFQFNGAEAHPIGNKRYASDDKNFGYGTVHHAVGTLRMPYRASWNQGFESAYVVDENLQVVGSDHLYVCDMSVMPFSSAANPVRTLAALALRLSRHLG